MPFHFPLQTVLHYRQSMEHQQELRLRAANQQVARAQHLIEQMDLQTKDLLSMEMEELNSGTSAAELQFGLLREAAMLRRRREFEQQLIRAQQLRGQQREIFQQARRAREMLESLRDQQLSLYKKDAARREQRSLDDLFLMRREYLRRS
jgi:flagellar export protein FliJ